MQAYDCDVVARGSNTAELYREAISLDVPIRMGRSGIRVGHELWIQDYGRRFVSEELFALPDRSLRTIVVWCPSPEICLCDYAQAWRKEYPYAGR